MRINFNIIKTFLILLLLIKNSNAETIQDIAKELNEIRNEISKLESTPISKPVITIVDKFGKTSMGVVVNSNKNSKIVTVKPLSVLGGKSYQSKLRTGVILGKSNLKDLAAKQSAQAEAELAGKKLAAERSLALALKEIDQATKFIDKSYNNGDIDGALAAIAVVEVAINDVSKNIPEEFKSEIIEKGKEFSKSEMEKIQSITNKIDKNKELAVSELSKTLEVATEKGFDVKKITDTVIKAGVKDSRLKEVYLNFTTDSLKYSLSETLKYKSLIGDSPSKVKNAVKQYEAITSGDPKKLRAFEIEKFGKAAGLDESTIKKGVEAIYNGNIDLEKKITKDILDKLGNNTNYKVKSLSENELDKLMERVVATEKAATAIKSSGIQFGKNSKEADLKKLASDVEKILSGKVSNDKIVRIKENIILSKNALIDQKGLSASIIATISGSNYEDALIKSSYGSIAYRAAAVEAALNDNLKALDNLKDDKSISKMSVQQLNQLSTVYRDIIEPEQKLAAFEAEKYNIMVAYGQSLKKDYEFAKEDWYNNYVAKGNLTGTKANKAFNKMNELQLKSTYMNFTYENIPNEFKDNYKKMEVASIEALKLTQDNVIAEKKLKDLKQQETDNLNQLNSLKSETDKANKEKLLADKNANDAKIAAQKAANLASQTSSSNATEEAKKAAKIASDQAQKAAQAAEVAAKEAASKASMAAAKLASAQASQTSLKSAKLAAQNAAKVAAKAAEKATNEAVKIASSKIVKKEIQQITADQLKTAYVKQHLAFSKALEAQGKSYFDAVTGQVKSTFDLQKFKAATDANVAASSQWQAIKSLAYSQNPIAANNAIKEIQKTIDSGSVTSMSSYTASTTKAAAQTATQASKAAEQVSKNATEAANKAANEAASAAKVAAEKAAANAADAAKAAAEAAAKQAAANAAAAAKVAAEKAAKQAKQAAETAAKAAKEAAAKAAKEAAAAAKQAAEKAAKEAAAAAKQAAEKAAKQAKEAAAKAAKEAKQKALNKQYNEALKAMNEASKKGDWKAYNEAGKKLGAAIRGELMN